MDARRAAKLDSWSLGIAEFRASVAGIFPTTLTIGVPEEKANGLPHSFWWQPRFSTCQNPNVSATGRDC